MIAYKIGFKAVLAASSVAWQVQALADDPLEMTDSPWSVELNLGVEREPAYTGSDVYTTEPDGNIELTYTAVSGHEYYVSLGEIGARWALGEGRELSTILEYEFGRENDADTALNGFPTVQDTVELQAIYQQSVGPLILGAGLQYDIRNRGKGTVGFIGAAHRRKLNSKLDMQVQFDLSFSDAEHMQTEVGISPEVAELTGYEAYSAKSGYKGASVIFGLAYSLTNQIQVRSHLAVEQYGSIMSDSPLIRDEGTPTNVETAVSVSYRF